MEWKKRLKLSTIQTRSMNTVEKMDIFPIGFVESFIENLLAQRENEIAEEVEKIDINLLDDEYIDVKTFRKKVLQILKH